MNKKSIVSVIYMVLALGICAAPAAAMPFSDNEQTSENRVLAQMPSILTEDGKLNEEWGTEFESYFSDHFAFRQNMADAYGHLEGSVFGTSAQEDVILGKDDWMYYTPTLEDYINQAKITTTGAKHIAHVLEMMSMYAGEHGAQFVFAPAPNKNSVYDEYMPARYICSDEADTLTLLEEEIAGTDVVYCDLRSVLSDLAENDDRLLYHKWDTHWNNYGAAIAYSTIMDTAGLQHTDYSELSFTEEKNWDGDLYKIIYPASDEKDSNFALGYDFSYTYAGRFRSVDDLVINTQSNNGAGTLLMFRDSFGRALLPFAAEDFASTSVQRAEHYPMDFLENSSADLVLLEIAERNLPNLLGYAPQMPAPEAVLSEDAVTADNCKKATLDIEKNGTYLHLYGTFDEAYSDHDGIYVSITDSEGVSKCYEAFPCYEYALLDEEKPYDNGYSMYIPTAEVSSGVNTVQLISLIDGEYINLGTAGQFQLGVN